MLKHIGQTHEKKHKARHRDDADLVKEKPRDENRKRGPQNDPDDKDMETVHSEYPCIPNELNGSCIMDRFKFRVASVEFLMEGLGFGGGL